MPAADGRFDLIVTDAQVRDVFLSLVADTPYSMLLHPAISGKMSLTLKGVSLLEVMESIRGVYGFDFKVDGKRISVFPPAMQTRVFSLNYLNNQRQGRTELRVSAGVSGNANPAGVGSGGASGPGGGLPGSEGQAARLNSSQVTTVNQSDFWADTAASLRAMVGSEGGRAVIVNPQAGTVAVRAMPDELREVEAFLKATRAAVERQVMLEAKIVEVELNEAFQSGINWSYAGDNGSLKQTGLVPLNGGAFGLALAGKGFESLLGFLESQGEVQILSSPRVATLNNQKAVLKVGSDDYFVTGITGGATTVNNGGSTNGVGVTLPSLSLTPFFSGIALDVTPQIDEDGMIALHVHPSVTQVSEKVKSVDLGTVGSYKLPLASSSVNETDTVVRIPDGAIVAIGGLMQVQSGKRRAGLPGSGFSDFTATLFGTRNQSASKRELVVLIKPTVIRSAQDWDGSNQASQARLEALQDEARRVIRVQGASPAP